MRGPLEAENVRYCNAHGEKLGTRSVFKECSEIKSITRLFCRKPTLSGNMLKIWLNDPYS